MIDPPPDGPRGVWLEYADGTRYEDLPTVYTGPDENGISMFEILTPRDERPSAAGAVYWPGLTGLTIPGIFSGEMI